ncbi:hypothetical protein ACFX15_009088 [Malus domestica]
MWELGLLRSSPFIHIASVSPLSSESFTSSSQTDALSLSLSLSPLFLSGTDYALLCLALCEIALIYLFVIYFSFLNSYEKSEKLWCFELRSV